MRTTVRCMRLVHSEAAEQDLRRLGQRGPASLTARELEIARLTVDRLTNRQIAGRLFLSEKTIESHMRSLFQKLGVSSRCNSPARSSRLSGSPRVTPDRRRSTSRPRGLIRTSEAGRGQTVRLRAGRRSGRHV